MDGREYMHMIYLTIRQYVPAPMTHWYSNLGWKHTQSREHNGLQQSARPHIRVSVGEEKWSDSETGKVIDGHNTAVFVFFLCQNALTTYQTGTQARI